MKRNYDSQRDQTSSGKPAKRSLKDRLFGSKREAAAENRHKAITLRDLKRLNNEIAWRVNAAEADFRWLEMSRIFRIPSGTRALVIGRSGLIQTIIGPCEHRFDQNMGDLLGPGTDAFLVIVDAGRFEIELTLKLVTRDGYDAIFSTRIGLLIEDDKTFYLNLLKDRPGLESTELGPRILEACGPNLLDWARQQAADHVNGDVQVRASGRSVFQRSLHAFCEQHGLSCDSLVGESFVVPMLDRVGRAGGRLDLESRVNTLKDERRGLTRDDIESTLRHSDALDASKHEHESRGRLRRTEAELERLHHGETIETENLTSRERIERLRRLSKHEADLEEADHGNRLSDRKIQGLEREDEYLRNRKLSDAMTDLEIDREEFDLAMSIRERKQDLKLKVAGERQKLELERAQVIQTLDPSLRLQMLGCASSEVARIEELNVLAKLSHEQLVAVLAPGNPVLAEAVLAKHSSDGAIERAKAEALREMINDARGQRDQAQRTSDQRSEQIVDRVGEIGVAEANAKRRPDQRSTTIVRGEKQRIELDTESDTA